MAKRFIDTNLFNDEWFCDLSKDGKIFFIYLITNCDHAGVFKLNKKLCEFQTRIKSIDTVIKELGNSIITVKEGLLFMPKFLLFQYPNFPNCNFKAALSAISILEGYGIDYTKEKLNSYLTVNEVLPNTYSISKGISNGNGKKENVSKKILFKDSELFDKFKFKEAFSEWSEEKLRHYWNAADAYSTEGNKYSDWKKAINNWASKDEASGKLKFNSNKTFEKESKADQNIRAINEVLNSVNNGTI